MSLVSVLGCGTWLFPIEEQLYSFTLDFVVLHNGTKEQAVAMKEELKQVLDQLGLKMSEEKTKITHITEGFKFLGYKIIRAIGTRGTMVTKVHVPEEAIKKARNELNRIINPESTNDSLNRST